MDSSDVNTPVNQLAAVINGNIDNDNIATNAGISGTKLATASIPGSKLGSHYAPQGFMQNGKISATVASNNLTVAIKTLAGTDPSSSDPVYVRVGNTVRSITSALSVTKNAGTNWFDSGSASHATQDMDYFVYIGYNATDGVTVGFSRIPYAIKYGDFSATSTNSHYAAISTITTAASSDEYELIGRFNATLSATASFNWSIPATAVVLNYPIRETRVLTFASALTNMSGGSFSYCRYQFRGREVTVRWKYVLAGAGISGSVSFAHPITASSDFNASDNGETLHSTVSLIDAGTAFNYGLVMSNSTTTGIVRYLNGSSNLVALSSTVPHVWGNTDFVEVSYKYDMA